jgi:hypothetical protein
MNVNAIRVQNSVKATSFGRKECCQECGQEAAKTPTITIPRIVYVALLLATLGGPLMTSCSTSDEPVTPVDTVKQAPAQKIITNMLQKMGIPSVTLSTKASSVVKGDLIEFGYHDVVDESKVSLKVSEDESTSSKMVYYGTLTNEINGFERAIRYSVSASSDNALLIKKEAKLNGSYSAQKTDEYKLNSDNTITQSVVESDGSRTALFKYSPKDTSSFYRTNLITGKTELVDDILAVQK